MPITYYQVALSFANVHPDGDVARSLHRALKGQNLDVFFFLEEDRDSRADGLGRALSDRLQELYSDRTQYCIILVSEEYLRRPWTRHEFQAALDRQQKENRREFILPYSVDGTMLPGLEDRVHAFHSELSPEEFARDVALKVSGQSRHHDVDLSLGKLTPEDPVDPALLKAQWQRRAVSAFGSSLNDRECAWVMPILPGRPFDYFDVTYDAQPEPSYDERAHPMVSDAIARWAKENPTRYEELAAESWGQQVRLSRVTYDHEAFRYALHLEPIKYLHYVSTHARLWSRELASLRESAFTNAVDGVIRFEPLTLPSHFCIHMAILDRTGRALLRQRRFHAELFPGAWEVGMGEFMHGPDKVLFPAFTDSGQPDLGMLLRSSVAEETAYEGARPEDFRVYGFAVEYRTLAPKLLVIYRSDLEIHEIIDGARRAMDFCQDAASVEVTPQAVAATMTDKARHPSWGPTSKLVLWLALLDQGPSEREREQISQDLEAELLRRG